MARHDAQFTSSSDVGLCQVLLASEVRPYDRVVAPNSLLASLNVVVVVRRCVVPHAH